MKGYLILLTIILITFQKKSNIQKVSIKGDHFFSKTTNSKDYILDNIQQKLPLIIFLKHKNQQNKSSKSNKIINKVNLKIEDNKNQIIKCMFDTYQQFCLLKQVQSKTNTKLHFQCEKVPCDIKFEFIQAQAINSVFDETLNVQTLYKIQKKNPIVKLYCNDSSIHQYDKKIKILSNINYTVLDQGNIRLYFFQDFLDYLVIMKDPEVQTCSNVKFEQVHEELPYKKAQQSVILNEIQIKVNKIPTNQLRIDMIARDFHRKKLDTFNITLFGIKQNQKKQIQLFQIPALKNGFQVDINLIIKSKKFQSFSSFAIKFSTQKPLFIRYDIQDIQIHDLDIQEQSYFNLDKDQNVQFNILTSKQNINQTIQANLITPNVKNNVEINLTCITNNQCHLTVMAKETSKIGIYIRYKRQLKNQEQYIQVDNQIKLTLHSGQIKYLIHNSSKNLNKFISVSSSNVLVYAAGQKCPKPSDQCFQYSGSLKHSIIIEGYNGILYIAVQALQLTSFILRFDDKNQTIQLNDGVPLSLNLQHEKKMLFKFRLKQKLDTTFNLIAPPNTFQMYITNTEQQPDIEDLNLLSSTNYIRYEKSQINQLLFTILIKKKVEKENQHFTLIASTKNSIILLDRSQPHYDVFNSKQQKLFALLINKKEITQKIQTFLSIDIFQKKTNFNLTLKLGNSIKNLTTEISINKSKGNTNIQKYTQQICKQESQQQEISDVCFIYLSLKNNQQKTLDITLNVLLSNSIIQLISGVWQSYQLSSLTRSNLYYFIPNNKKNPIYLMFTHTYGVYKINYVLFNNKDKIRNAGEWPFPNSTQQLNDTSNIFRNKQYIIQPQQINKCFPNCIVLISLQNGVKQKSTDPNVVQPIFYGFGVYSIMATDSIIEIVQSQKISISLNKNEVKLYNIPITQYLKQNKTLTLFTSDMIGSHIMFAYITTNRLDVLPNQRDHDFRIDGYEMQITSTQINQILSKKQLESHEQIDLLFYAKCEGHCKFIFQFTTKQKYIQQLYVGIPINVKLQPHSEKIFSVFHFADFKIKFTRIRGYPIIVYMSCPFNEMDDCYQQLEKKQNQTIVSKISEISIKYQFRHVYFLKIYSKEQNVEMEVVPSTLNGSIQLKQGVIMTDFVQVNSSNFYKIQTIKDQVTIITITIFQGNPTATVKNQQFNKTKSKLGNIIQFYVHSQQSLKNKETKNLVNSFSYVNLEITDKIYNSSYSIVYTLGQRYIDLIDGVLTASKLKQNETIIYNYINHNNKTAIVTLTFMNAQMMNNCEIILFSYNDESEPIESKPQKLKTNTKTPKPSLTFQLDPQYINYQIKLKNKKNNTIELLITINHIDLVYLPLEYQYPIYINQNSLLIFVVEIMNQGHVEVIVKKCSETDLIFSYSIGDKNFLNEQYAYSQELEENRLVSLISTNESRIYFKLESIEGAIFSILVNKYQDKKLIKKTDFKAGNKGQIFYYLMIDNKVQIQFSPVVCNSKCEKISYYYLIGQNQEQVISQAACPGNFFIRTEAVKILLPKSIKYEKYDQIYKFQIDYPVKNSFLAIKAIIDGKNEVTYKIIQIVTFWQGLKKNRKSHIALIGFLIIGLSLILCLVCRCWTKKNLNAYRNLQDNQS